MIKKLCLAAGSTVFLFLLLEGVCSSVFVAREALGRSGRTLSGLSVRYDDELGWVCVPDFYDPNYYAPGVALRTNSQGFRANGEFTEQVPSGRVRVICSGDSQTFGDGVGNDATWCQRLESLDARIEAVNIAETGYGVDQMYLWYQRAGSRLNHDVHVFAVVTDDFRRLQYTSVGGYGKPVLKLENGELTTGNVPVPRHSSLVHWLALKPHPLRQFRSLAALAWLVERLAPAPPSGPSADPTEQQRQIVDRLLDALQTMERQKNSVLVVLYLPTRLADYDPGGPSLPWRAFLRAESEKKGFVFVDLLDDFQQMPLTMKDGMFIWPGSVHYFAEAPGHYDDQGQEWVARELYAKLMAAPAVARKLGDRSRTEISEEGATD
jgi:hypothetical protein